MRSALVDHAVMVCADLSAHTICLRPGAEWDALWGSEACVVFGHPPKSGAMASLGRGVVRGGLPHLALSSALPWALVSAESPRSVVAIASVGLPSGIFYLWLSSNPGRLTIGLDPRSVMEASQTGGSINANFLLGFLRVDVDVTQTPVAEVSRVPPGSYLTWSPGEAPVTTKWWHLEDPAPQDRRTGSAARGHFLAAFDAAVEELMTLPGTLAAQLSGGLDSTFMVASMARQAPPGRPVQAFTHVPTPGAAVSARPNFVNDDSPWAEALVAAYPDRVNLACLSNSEGRMALDVSAEANRRSWWPVFNPGNEVWLEQVRGRARSAGAQILFTGSSGNFSFSHQHSYALADALRSGHFWRAAQGIAYLAHGGASWRTAVQLTRRRSSPRGSGGSEVSFLLPTDDDAPQGQASPTERARLIKSLTCATRPYVGALNPRLTRGLLSADPFLAPNVVEAAAHIDPIEWWRGPWPRGLARTLGSGRVPDSVRFRRERGAQAADAWWFTRHAKDRYLNEVEQLTATPHMRDWVDHARLLMTVTEWPWGLNGPGPPPRELNSINRLLSLADFARYLASELYSQPG